MAESYKVLGQVKPVAGTSTTLYTVPAATSAVTTTLVIANLGASTTYRLEVRPAGAALEDKHSQGRDIPLAANDAVYLTVGFTLAATDVVAVQSASGTVSFSLFGSELT